MNSSFIDAKVLGQLLLMQSMVNYLPDKTSIFKFVCKGLLDLPGVEKAEYFENSTEIPGDESKRIRYSINVGNTFNGELVLSISNRVQYMPYDNYLRNFAFMIAIILEERKNKQQIEEYKQQLELRIAERTTELVLEKEKLIESQRRFSDLMRNVKLLSVMLDRNGNVLFINDYLLKLTQYTSEEVLGQNWFDLFLDEDIRSGIRHIYKKVMNGRKSVIPNFESEILTKKGKKILISWNNTVLRDENKAITGTASIGENITERKLTEEALINKNIEYKYLNDEYLALNEKLTQNLEDLQNINNQLALAKLKAEESDRLKTAFLQNMSHEIRTPLNAIMGFSSLLALNYENKPKLEKYSEIISQRSQDLLEIINDILDIAKIESGQLSIYNEEFNLRDLFEELDTFFREYMVRLGKEHLSFSLNVDLPEESISIRTDRVKLKQILINLISNAFKFTYEGSVKGGCQVNKHQNIQFYVSDTGIGIPFEKQALVFERFVQLHDPHSRNAGGTGLGLSIVKGLVQVLGGEIDLTSEVGNGSKFTFTLPVKVFQK